ncbi:sulfatase-like hydrolase/transferase [Lutibacter sp. TH_r2]|uniref:sulfatase-like hydrolase/transferase n=1 Tax=Lutibacter sp. TH_r2 TaxID=3082083 RepID=UPI00295300C0|nr:sulfatase-like hydrolase/transferase [Lutibacter sp. TH_r2]MDV7186295.1 sulfatase-like hydrolase/transferase [Lutibacter sp. TH_r2]
MIQHKTFNFYIFLVISIILFSCSEENDDFTDPVIEEDPVDEIINNKPNILLVIADDMGLDASPGYSIGSTKPNMPNLQHLINTGITYNYVWSNPTCSPTRATILTGKYGINNGVLEVNNTLSAAETSLQTYIDTNLNGEYASAVIGKWHLSNNKNHPEIMGIEYYAGFLSGAMNDYWNWKFTENGTQTTSTTYNTTAYTNIAIDWIEEQTKPWFVWLAYNAPHNPFHLPPIELHSQGSLATDQASIDANPLPYYLAMLEAMDTEFGRLLNSLSEEEKENTIIIFIGDNGTPNQVAQEYNSKRVKGSLYQGGINVPMVIAGKNVTRINEVENALINTTDLFATIANIAGIQIDKINDSKSFQESFSNSSFSEREYAYAEDEFNVTIRNNTHKYMLFDDNSESLFNLSIDPLETKNLLNSKNLPLSENDSKMKDELTQKLAEIKP